MKTYTFRVVVQQDEDRWFAYCLPLLQQGGSTWGTTKLEALENIEEVVRLVVESLFDQGETVPEGPADQVQVTADPLVASSCEAWASIMPAFVASQVRVLIQALNKDALLLIASPGA